MHSIRFQFIAFITAILLVLLLLLNTYPLLSSRDAVFEEKRSSLSAQGATVASSLAGLDRLSRDSIAEVLRFLDVSGYSRIVVADAAGAICYDSGSGGDAGEDIARALTGKTVFRSVFRDQAFASSFAMPMSAQGALTGAIYLYEYDAERAQIILNIQNQIRAASLTIAALTLALAAVLSFLLIRRVRELVRSMHIVASGDYSYRHSLSGRDEITELGSEFNQLTERLQTTEQQRRRFVSDASHELKTPLASIRLLSDSIAQNEQMDPETMREFVSDIGGEAQRLQRTTEKLLDLSRLDDKVQFVPEPVDLKQAALDAIASLRPLAQEKRVRLRSELEEGCVVMGSRPTGPIFSIAFTGWTRPGPGRPGAAVSDSVLCTTRCWPRGAASPSDKINRRAASLCSASRGQVQRRQVYEQHRKNSGKTRGKPSGRRAHLR